MFFEDARVVRSSTLPGKTIENFWKFPSGGIGNGQFEPDSFVVSGLSRIH